MELKRKTYLCKLRHLLVVAVVSFFVLKGDILSAQEATITATHFTDILLNSDVMQTVQILEENALPLNNAQVTTTVNNPDVVSLSLLNPSQSITGFDVNSGSLTANTNNNGQISLIIKGISQGTATITSIVDEVANVTTETINVNVIGVEAKINVSGQTSGTLPFSVTFNDASAGDNITSRKWDFGDGSSPVLDVLSATHIYNTTGVHNVSLEITAQSNIGTVTVGTSTAICVFPPTGPVGTGTGSVHGVVWFEKTLSGQTFRIPLAGVEVTLAGKNTFTTKTDNAGIYNLDNVPSGNYAAFACISGICDKENSDLVVTDNTDRNLEFVLTN